MKNLIGITAAALLVTIWGTQAAEPSEGAALFKKKCASCHGDDGKGETRMGKRLGAKDYTDPKVLAELKDEKAFTVIKEGLKEDGKTKMKPEGDLTDAQIKALIAHMKAFGKK